MIPLSLFPHSLHLISFRAQALQKTCPQSTSTGLSSYLEQQLQVSCGLYFSTVLSIFSRSSFWASSGLFIRLHRSLSEAQKSFSSYQPVLRLERSCKQRQLLPKGQQPESCQSLHRLRTQSNLHEFLMVELSLEGPIFFLYDSSAVFISLLVSLWLAYAFMPRYILVLSFPSFISFVVSTFSKNLFLASSSSNSSAGSSRSLIMFLPALQLMS